MKFPATLAVFAFAPFAAAQDAPLPPARAAAAMTAPAGFKTTLFAGEPDVVQPIAFAFDTRGRMWVAECLSYPKWRLDGKGNDRIVILEDADGDGKAEKRTVFADNVSNLSGIELGFGGVWICSTPNLAFIPDADGDDKPDGPPQILLDGWNVKDTKHNIFNSLAWGPDGWLWGCNGIQSNSLVGAPGTPAKDRTPMNCGVWRYHPTKKKFDVVAHGTTNPFGLAFDAYGQAFITNCVIDHLWHVVPGARFQRMYGQDYQTHAYELMTTCADHKHWAGGDWTESRGAKGAHGDAGGGHAHSGAAICPTNSWPAEFHNSLFTCNIHGSRVNRDVLKVTDKGYVASHAPDFLHANDPWFRGIAAHFGPDGALYASDWTDTGECHNYEVVDRANGRIYRVAYGKQRNPGRDLAKLSDQELVALQAGTDPWSARQARRLLQERKAAGSIPSLAALASAAGSPLHLRLNSVWTLFALDGLDEKTLPQLLADPEPWIRHWAVRAASDGFGGEKTAAAVRDLAANEKSEAVLLALAGMIPKAPIESALLANPAVRSGSANFARLVWYGVEPKLAAAPERTAEFLPLARRADHRRWIGRRLASMAKSGPGGTEILDKLLAAMAMEAVGGEEQQSVLRGALDGLSGRRNLSPPSSWDAYFSKLVANPAAPGFLDALRLGLIFNLDSARSALHARLADKAAPNPIRIEALDALRQDRDPKLLPRLKELVGEPDLRGAALRAFTAYDDVDVPTTLLEAYPKLTFSEKADAVGVLSARIGYADKLVAAVESGSIPPRDLDAFSVRQLHALGNAKLSQRLNKVWGAVRSPSKEKAAAAAKYKQLLAAEKGDSGRGHEVFRKNCAACHVLFGAGGKIGPELTGGQRTNLDYVLENLLDPSAVVGREFKVSVLRLADGRVLTGIVLREDDNALSLQTPTDLLALAKSDIENRKQSNLSLMPEGLLDRLSPQEVRDLAAYLAAPGPPAKSSSPAAAGGR